MKKYLALFGAGLASFATFAEGAAVTADTNLQGILSNLSNTISANMDSAWPIITTIVGVGIVVWLGRVLIRAVRSYFATAM